MKVRFYLDPETGQPHIYDHGVTEKEVLHVLGHAGDHFKGRGNSRTVLGQTATGRYLKVIYIPDPHPGNGFVITAYEMPRKLRKAYRRRRRKK